MELVKKLKITYLEKDIVQKKQSWTNYIMMIDVRNLKKFKLYLRMIAKKQKDNFINYFVILNLIENGYIYCT